jgi:hypothetical protein
MEKQIILAKEGDVRYAAEAQLQEACTKWFWNVIGEPYRRMLFHVNNNSTGSVRGAQNRSLGVVRGVSDLVFISFGETIYIELKLPGRTQEPEQIDFMNKVLERGHRYILCYSFEGFKNLIYTEINKHEQ